MVARSQKTHNIFFKTHRNIEHIVCFKFFGKKLKSKWTSNFVLKFYETSLRNWQVKFLKLYVFYVSMCFKKNVISVWLVGDFMKTNKAALLPAKYEKYIFIF